MEQSLIIPDSRNSFIDHIKVRLGGPDIRINVTRLQIEVRIEEALKLYKEWHGDATNDVYYSHLITEENVTNSEFQFPQNIHRVSNLLTISGEYGASKGTMWFPGTSGLSSLSNPFYMQSMGSFGQQPLTMMFLRKQYHAEINFTMRTKDQFTFDFHNKILKVVGENNKIVAGNYIVVEASIEIDEIWNDDWLIRYTTELVRFQWGQNMSKFDNVTLPNGMTINGTEMMNDAKEKLDILKTEVIEEHGNYSFIITG